MITHIFENNCEEFSEPFIDFVNSNFNIGSHEFIVMGEDIRKKPRTHVNLLFVKSVFDRQFIKILNKSDKIILHSMFNPRLLLLLFLKPRILKKIYWVIWGGDLYFHYVYKENIKYRLYEFLRRSTFKRFYAICSLVENDYYIARDIYNISDKRYKAIYINKNLNEWVGSLKGTSDQHDGINILLGNSATESNRHLEAIEWLSVFKNEDIKIYCPLSYGDSEYAQNVISFSKQKFGNKFIPMLEKLEHSEYTRFLNTIDIGVFNNDRQQGLGNIYTLLELGKKVYVRDDTTTWAELAGKFNITLFATNKLQSLSFDEFKFYDESHRQENMSIMEEYNSEEYAIKLWSEIFHS